MTMAAAILSRPLSISDTEPFFERVTEWSASFASGPPEPKSSRTTEMHFSSSTLFCSISVNRPGGVVRHAFGIEQSEAALLALGETRLRMKLGAQDLLECCEELHVIKRRVKLGHHPAGSASALACLPTGQRAAERAESAFGSCRSSFTIASVRVGAEL